MAEIIATETISIYTFSTETFSAETVTIETELFSFMILNTHVLDLNPINPHTKLPKFKGGRATYCVKTDWLICILTS